MVRAHGIVHQALPTPMLATAVWHQTQASGVGPRQSMRARVRSSPTARYLLHLQQIIMALIATMLLQTPPLALIAIMLLQTPLHNIWTGSICTRPATARTGHSRRARNLAATTHRKGLIIAFRNPLTLIARSRRATG